MIQYGLGCGAWHDLRLLLRELPVLLGRLLAGQGQDVVDQHRREQVQDAQGRDDVERSEEEQHQRLRAFDHGTHEREPTVLGQDLEQRQEAAGPLDGTGL